MDSLVVSHMPSQTPVFHLFSNLTPFTSQHSRKYTDSPNSASLVLNFMPFREWYGDLPFSSLGCQHEILPKCLTSHVTMSQFPSSDWPVFISSAMRRVRCIAVVLHSFAYGLLNESIRCMVVCWALFRDDLDASLSFDHCYECKDD